MTKLKLEQCPECDEVVYGLDELREVDEQWQHVWTCPECGCEIISDSVEE